MEELNNQNPEINSGSKPKGSKKKFLVIGIVIAIVLVLVIVAGVILSVTGKVNVSKKAKFMSSISKAKELATAPIDAIAESEPIKLSNNLGDSDIQYTAEITGHVDSFEIHATETADNAKTVDAIKQLINGSKINVDVKVDQKEKAMEGTVGLAVDGLLDKVTANIAYKNNAMALSFPDFSDKKLGVFADTLENSTEYKDLAKVFKAIDGMDTSSMSDMAKLLTITKEEKDHFKKTYKGIFKKQIKANQIKSKSDKIEVDGKEKSVTATTVTLDKDDVQKIIEAYIDVFEDDEKGKEILVDKAYGIYSLMASGAASTGVSMQAMSKEDFEKQLDESVSSAKDNLEKVISFKGEIEITSYATMFESYGLDIEYSEGDNTMGIYFVFGKDKTDYTVKSLGEKVASGEIVSTKDEQKLSVVVDNVQGMNVKGELGVEHTSKTETKVFLKGTLKQKDEKVVDAEIAATIDVQKNEDNEYSDKVALTINVDAPKYVTFVGGININETIKKADVTVEDINRTNCIDVLSTASQNELKKYEEEITPKVQERLKKIQDSELYKLIESLSKQTTNVKQYDYNTTTDNNTVTNTTYDYNSIDYNAIDYNAIDYNAILNSVNVVEN